MSTQQNQYRSTRAQKILLELNKTGLHYLKFQQFGEAYQFFKNAEKIILEELKVSSRAKIFQMAAVTFNNLACYYKKTKKPKVALGYLQKCLQLEVQRIGDWVSTGSTHLNICAIYSYLNRHQQALCHAKLSLQLLNKLQINTQQHHQKQKSYHNIKMLSHYNKAIQEQHLSMIQDAILSYKSAKKIARVSREHNKGVIVKCEESIVRLQSKVIELRSKMINVLLKRQNDFQRGHCESIFKNKKNPLANVEQHRMNKFTLYKIKQPRRAKSNERKLNPQQKVIYKNLKNITTSSHFKSMKEYVNEKRLRTEPANTPLSKK